MKTDRADVVHGTRRVVVLVLVSFASVVAAKKIGGVPLKRLGEVEEVVEAVAFLLSDESAYITGTSLVVAGGMA